MNFDSLMSSLKSTVSEIRPLGEQAVDAVKAVQQARTSVALAQLDRQRTVAEAQLAYRAGAAQMSPAFSAWQTNAQRYDANVGSSPGVPAWLLVVAAAGLVWMVAR